MSTTYTTADVRKMVDDLDEVVRAAVDKGVNKYLQRKEEIL